MDILLVAFQLRRPGDTEDADVLLAVRQDFLTLLPARTDDFVLLGALWDEGLAQEVVDVFGALQVCQRHKRLEEYKKKKEKSFIISTLSGGEAVSRAQKTLSEGV